MARSIDVGLSAKGLANIHYSYQKPDFQFIVGDERYPCSSFVAEFVSPKVSRLRQADGTIQAYQLKTPDQHNHFPDLLLLGQGHRIKVKPDALKFMADAARELENSELLFFLEFPERDISIENAVHRLREKGSLGLGSDFEIGFIAAHFFEIPDSNLKLLSYDSLDRVLGHVDIRMQSEDVTFELILQLSDENPEFFGLLEHVAFQYLSVDSVRHFAAISSGKLLPYLNATIWARICDRLVEGVQTLPFEERRKRYATVETLEVPFGTTKKMRLNGILAHLMRREGSNPHDRGLVEATSSSLYNMTGTCHPKVVLDQQPATFYISQHIPNQWLQLDFKRSTVIPTGYVIRGRQEPGVVNINLRSWKLEGSLDGSEWEILDSKTNVNELSVHGAAVGVWPIDSRVECKFIRLTSTGPSLSGNQYLTLSYFDLFGSLLEA
jgi:hypothetical protein